MPILVFLGVSVLDLGPMHASDRPDFRNHRLMPPPSGRGLNKLWEAAHLTNVKLFQSRVNGCFSMCCVYATMTTIDMHKLKGK